MHLGQGGGGDGHLGKLAEDLVKLDSEFFFDRIAHDAKGTMRDAILKFRELFYVLDGNDVRSRADELTTLEDEALQINCSLVDRASRYLVLMRPTLRHVGGIDVLGDPLVGLDAQVDFAEGETDAADAFGAFFQAERSRERVHRHGIQPPIYSSSYPPLFSYSSSYSTPASKSIGALFRQVQSGASSWSSSASYSSSSSSK